MARTHVETIAPNTDVTDVQERNVNEMIEAGKNASIAQAAVMDSFDVIKAIGRIEAAQFYETISEKLIVETAINMREGKKYKGLPFSRDGKTETVSTFDEFCEIFLGKTGRRITQLISNYNQLGPELYEQAERIGFRQRDYNALKALPADDRLLIAQAIEEESLDKALDLMQEMAAKHMRDKQALTEKLEEHALNLDAKDRVIEAKIEENTKKTLRIAQLEAEKIKKAELLESPEQRLLDLRSNLQICAATIKSQVMSELRKNVKALADYAEETGISETAFMTTSLIEITRELAILQAEYYLPNSIDASPVDPIWAAMAAGEEIVVPGAAEFAARMAEQDSE